MITLRTFRIRLTPPKHRTQHRRCCLNSFNLVSGLNNYHSNNMKHLRLFLGVLALMLACVTAQAAKGDIFTIGNLKYTVLAAENATTLTGKVSVMADATTISGIINIPETVDNNGYTYTVTTIPSQGFLNCVKITSVVLPNTITTLGTYAFRGCTKLQSINIPNGIKTIPEGFCYLCSSLRNITIPNTVTKLGGIAFRGCSMMSKVVMSNQITTIPYGCFQECSVLSSIDLSKIKTIQRWAFADCRNLTEVSLDSLTTLSGVSIFQKCTKLKKVKLGKNVTTLSQDIFSGCTALESINIENVKNIGLSAFYNCSSLPFPVFNENVEVINSWTFYGCKAFTEIIIPNSVKRIGAEAFAYCTNVEKITLSDNLVEIDAGAFSGGDGIETAKYSELILPTSLKRIGNVIAKHSNIRVLKIPNSVDSIGQVILSHTESIHMTLPSWLKYGGQSMPGDASEVTIPAYMKTIEGQMYKNVYIMGDKILPGINHWSNTTNSYNTDINLYVKKSVFDEKYSDGKFQGCPVSYNIPVSMTNGSGEGIEYKTLCRDFDVDLTHTNDNLPEGVEPLRAYLVEDVEGDLRMVFLNEIKYIPSRLKANVTDENGNLYQGVDEYVGVILRGTPGYTYYYRIGEHDYTQGAEGQWLMEDAMAYSGSSFENNLMSGDANDEFYIYKNVKDNDGNDIVNYGLNHNRFKIYNKDGWLYYNKSYLQLPKHVSDAIEGDTDAEGNANLTFVFNNADGTTDKVSSVEFNRNCESDIFYNPYGQRVDANTKGIVINNGRKFINK